MRIGIVTPASGSRLKGHVTGNAVTAERWREMLRKLGHDATVSETYEGDGTDVDVLVALHGRKSAPSIHRFAERAPNTPLVVTLTGTDLYEDLPDNEDVRRSLRVATHLIVLQPAALERIDADLRPKTTVIYQSAKPIVPVLDKAANCFQVALIAHLRPVKDPDVAQRAALALDDSSRVQIVHAGAAETEELARTAREIAGRTPRYRWIGAISHEEARLLIARSHLLLLTSRAEGAANVLSEALAIGIPILASRAPGIQGVLGERYPGYFPVGDADTLSGLLGRAAHDEIFYRRLELACQKLAPMVAPSWELRSWQQLLHSLT